MSNKSLFNVENALGNIIFDEITLKYESELPSLNLS